MTAPRLSRFSPAVGPARRYRAAWACFLVLFPFAYLAAIHLEFSQERRWRIEGALDRAQSVEKARQFLKTQDLDVTGWADSVSFKANENLIRYYTRKEAAGCTADLAPGTSVQVSFRSPESRTAVVFLSVTGKLSGFDLQHARRPSMRGAMADSDAERIALGSIQREVACLGSPEVETPTRTMGQGNPESHQFAWLLHPKEKPEIGFRVVVTVEDERVIAKRINPELNADYVKRELASTTENLQPILQISSVLFLVFASCYALYRYTRRTLEKEVSHRRTAVVGVFFTISLALLTYCFAGDQVIEQLREGNHGNFPPLIFVFFVIMYSVFGLLVGMAYGSGEGDVREAYPGKLTSLDALLTGRWGTRDVAASVFCGAAFGGWLMLIQQAIASLIPFDPLGSGYAVLTFNFARFPWLAFLFSKQYDTVVMVTAGLLLPASLVQRTRKRPWLTWTLFFTFILLSVLRPASRLNSPVEIAAYLLVLAAAIVLPFFAYDLLAAFVAVSALTYVSTLVRLAAVLPSWAVHAPYLTGLGVAAVLAAAIVALYGNDVSEEEVTPRYAKHLAQRLALQAEVGTAREAQLRLLPQSVPSTLGLAMAASCLPSRVVGGDFYDFFPLASHRVGVFVADGGKRGLASALTIALAKGFLMHAVVRNSSPGAILSSLCTSLGSSLRGAAGQTGLAYAVIDSDSGTLEYARIGDYPEVLLYSGDASQAATPLTETSVWTDGGFCIHQASARLFSGDSVVIFTDGLVSHFRPSDSAPGENWIRTIAGGYADPAEQLHTLLEAAHQKMQDRLDDDLTAVVVRVLATQSYAREGAA